MRDRGWRITLKTGDEVQSTEYGVPSTKYEVRDVEDQVAKIMSGTLRTPYSVLRTLFPAALIEIALIFAVFAIQGAWPVPDVNEPYYLGKAIHYWNPDWLRGDFFMESADTHKVFYFTFGWLSLWLGPVALCWTGRILTWGLLAWAWRRLSWAVVPRAWYSVLTAALFACLMDRCHMAGEWVIGGVEAKGFAYVFVFLGLEALVRNRWNRALLLFGAAAAFHVLVGGWAAVAAGIAWIRLILPSPACGRGAGGEGRVPVAPPLRSLWPGLLGGLLLALPGLVPSLTLDWGVDSQTTRAAHQIYVFERLPHHLVLAGMRPEFILRLGLLWVFWLVLGRWGRRARQEGRHSCLPGERQLSGDRQLRRMSVLLAGVCHRRGGHHLARSGHPAANLHQSGIAGIGRRSAPLLLVPIDGRCAAAGRCAGRDGTSGGIAGRWGRHSCLPMQWQTRMSAPPNPADHWLALAILVAAFHLGDRAIDRMAPQPPRSHRLADFESWHAACQWVANSGNIPPGARFLVPRLAQTFKWYTGHSDVATWKDVPQDAKSIVQWWDRIQDIYATGQEPPEPRWYDPLAVRGAGPLRQLGAKYGADYLITEVSDPMPDLPVVYSNRTYVIFRLR